MFAVLLTVTADAGSLIDSLIGYWQAGEAQAAVGAALALAVLVLRWLLGMKVAWFRTPTGGTALVFGSALIGSIAASWQLGQGWLSPTILTTALSAAWTATGIHHHVQKANRALKARAARKRQPGSDA